MHTVAAYSAQSLRPLTGGFSDGFLNGTWTALLMQVTFGFRSPVIPSTASRVRRRVLIRSCVCPTHSARRTSPRRRTGVRCSRHDQPHHRREREHTERNPSESGIAFYAMDPRCDA